MEIAGIFIRSGWYIDQMQVLYRKPATGQLVLGPTHGGNGGGQNSFVLNPGEFINEVSGRSGSYLDSITFRTNQGRRFPSWGRYGGTGGGLDYQFPDPPEADVELYGLFGRSGDYVDALGFHFRQRPVNLIGNLAILGVEVTQSIQYWDSPAGQGSGYAANNSVPLVSQRETILRVYLNVGGGVAPPPAIVTGLVTVSGFSLALGYGTKLDLQPLGGPIAGKPLISLQRSSLGDTLNFRIPGDICQGTIQCDVKVFELGNPANSAETFIAPSFKVVPRLSVHGVLVHYTGVDYFDKPVDAQPNGLDLAATLDWVYRTYPIPAIDYTGCTVLPWSAKLAITQNFNDLFGKVAALRAMSGSNDIYVGLIPPAAGCGGICGLGGGGSATFFAGNGPEAAHEIGHALGRAHTQCAVTSGDPDPNYPNYDGFPQGSIGECGIDAYQLKAFDPRTTFDFMSYCEPVWISPYTYLGLMNAITSTYATAQASAAYEPASIWAAPKTEFLYLQLRLYRRRAERQVEVRISFSIRGGPSRPNLSSEQIAAEVVDSQDGLVGTYPCAPLDPHHDENDAFQDVAVTIPVLSDMSVIRIVRAGDVLATLHPAKESPKVEITETTMAEAKNLIRIRWKAEADPKSDPGLQYGLRYSHDGGTTWLAIAAGLSETSHVLDLDLLPGGSECRLQVIASAGFRSALAETPPIKVAKKPRRAYILPNERSEFEYGEEIPLMGGGFSPDFGVAPPESTVWTSTIRGLLGKGNLLTLVGLPLGSHVIALHVPDGLGGEAITRTELTITPPEARHAVHSAEKSPESIDLQVPRSPDTP
jgi:hypothetical protein